jgi:mannose-6-phosphate isomerase-like protein (cupin superfamily)
MLRTYNKFEKSTMDIEKYINSGTIEMYVMGALPADEAAELKFLAAKHPEIDAEIQRTTLTLESYAFANAKKPNPQVKMMLMATLDYMQRIENGETPVAVPALSKETKKEDFSGFIDHPHMQAPAEYKHAFIKVISYTSQHSTAIVWLKEGFPQETHHNAYESFFILEGTCNIYINDEIHQLYPGDQLTIPLHSTHSVQVTSDIPCKLILERKAA